MTEMSYRTRPSWFSDRMLACRLQEEGLHCLKGWSRNFAYDQVDEIRIIYFWGRYGLSIAHAVVHGRGGRITVPSCNEERLGDADCQADTYVPFVEGLVERVQAANPDAVFTTGSTALWVTNWTVAAAAAAMGLVLVDLPSAGGSLSALLAFGIAGGMAFYAGRLGRRREIGADALLEKLRSHLGAAGRRRSSPRGA